MYLALRHFGSLSPTKKKLVCYFSLFFFFKHKKNWEKLLLFYFFTSYFSASFLFLFILDFYFFLAVFIFALVLSCLRIQFVTHFALHVFFVVARFASQFRQPAFLFDSLSFARCATSSSLHINSSIWTVWLHTQRVLKTQSKHIQWNENINLYTYYHTIILACE